SRCSLSRYVMSTPHIDSLSLHDALPISIPILLNFEVGRLTLPIGELAGWQPGTLVEIEPPRIDDGIEVVIRANGKWIGSGDLVRVGERLAVRIARLGSRGEAAGQEAGDES